MGTRITSNDTLAPWYSKVVPPVTRGLEAWFTFDTDISRFGLNRAIGKLNGSVIGAPTAFATHGRFKGGVSYIQTAVKDSDEITMFAVVKALVAPTSNADGVAAISTSTGTSVTPAVPGPSGGSSILLRGSSVASAGIARSPGGAYNMELVNIVGAAPTAWRLLCVRAKSGAASEVRDMTYNVSKLGTDLTTRVVNDKLFRIGSSTAEYSGESDISAAAIYSAYLTDDEINLVAGAMRKRMLRLGVSV